MDQLTRLHGRTKWSLWLKTGKGDGCDWSPGAGWKPPPQASYTEQEFEKALETMPSGAQLCLRESFILYRTLRSRLQDGRDNLTMASIT